MASFLAEAVAQSTRRPQELWELNQSLLASSDGGGGEGIGSQPGFSELAVCCLRNALKVAASARMPSDARCAIASYTAGETLV